MSTDRSRRILRSHPALNAASSTAVFVGSLCLVAMIPAMWVLFGLYAAGLPLYIVAIQLVINLVCVLAPAVIYLATARSIRYGDPSKLNLLMITGGVQLVNLTGGFIFSLYRPNATQLVCAGVGIAVVLLLLVRGGKCYAALDELDEKTFSVDSASARNEAGKEESDDRWPELR